MRIQTVLNFLHLLPIGLSMASGIYEIAVGQSILGLIVIGVSYFCAADIIRIQYYIDQEHKRIEELLESYFNEEEDA